jgi:tetratricopeptide (TPR) repeat protein
MTMNKPAPPTQQQPEPHVPWLWIIGAILLLVILMTLLFRRGDNLLTDGAHSANPLAQAQPRESTSEIAAQLYRRASRGKGALTAEEIVASKVKQFARSRRDFVRALARRANKDVPDEVERFFDALEGGNWDEIEAAFAPLSKRSGQYEGSTHSPDLDEIWPAVLDAFGAAEQAHDWPAQKLLDYGNAVLESLRPGMVYVGGTDPGRWIPSLLNDTSDGERHIVLTQNPLADKRYLDYVEFLYGDRLATPTHADSDRVFAEYVADVQRRFEHDQQFPDEPKQVRPGENGRFVDGKFQVSGQVSVMAINEKLFQLILEKNPSLSFAMEESFPFKSTFAEASPLGPIMELRVRDEQRTLTPERAAQTVDYWRNTTQGLLADPNAISSHEVRASYSKLLSSQAGLLVERKHTAEAEQLFRLANEVCPYSPEAVFRYINLLVEQNRVNDAVPIAENAIRNARDDSQQFRDLLAELNRMKQK